MMLPATRYPTTMRTISGAAIIYENDVVLLCDTSSGPVTMDLLEIPNGYWSTTYKLYVIDLSGNASVNNITINAGTDQTIDGAASKVINTNSGYLMIQICGNSQYVTTDSGGGGTGTPFKGTNWNFVYANTTHALNADQLQAAYDEAKASTPNGSPLSASNRFTVIVAPGYYNFSSAFEIDTEFVDIVSLTGNADVIIDQTVNVTANNVFLKGIDTAGNQFAVIDDRNQLVMENCKGGDNSFAAGLQCSGTYIKCQGGSNSFGGGITGQASGNFTDCLAGTAGFGGLGGQADGTFLRCEAGQYGFAGGGGIASGTFTDCKSYNYSFGGGGAGTASGTFLRCSGLLEAFGGGDGGTSSGLFDYCTGDARAFGGGFSTSISEGTYNYCQGGDDSFGGGGGTASGTYIYCIGLNGAFGGLGGMCNGTFKYCNGGNNSFAGDDTLGGTASGEFSYCRGGQNAFAGSPTTGGTASGTFTNCIGDANSYGLNGTLSGQCYFCRITAVTTFETVSGAGRTIYCIDGLNNTNNQ